MACFLQLTGVASAGGVNVSGPGSFLARALSARLGCWRAEVPNWDAKVGIERALLHLHPVSELQRPVRLDSNDEAVCDVGGESSDAVACSHADSLMNGE